jgi:hypothetical protein
MFGRFGQTHATSRKGTLCSPSVLSTNTSSAILLWHRWRRHAPSQTNRQRGFEIHAFAHFKLARCVAGSSEGPRCIMLVRGERCVSLCSCEVLEPYLFGSTRRRTEKAGGFPSFLHCPVLNCCQLWRLQGGLTTHTPLWPIPFSSPPLNHSLNFDLEDVFETPRQPFILTTCFIHQIPLETGYSKYYKLRI